MFKGQLQVLQEECHMPPCNLPIAASVAALAPQLLWRFSGELKLAQSLLDGLSSLYGCVTPESFYTCPAFITSP